MMAMQFLPQSRYSTVEVCLFFFEQLMFNLRVDCLLPLEVHFTIISSLYMFVVASTVNLAQILKNVVCG